MPTKVSKEERPCRFNWISKRLNQNWKIDQLMASRIACSLSNNQVIPVHQHFSHEQTVDGSPSNCVFPAIKTNETKAKQHVNTVSSRWHKNSCGQVNLASISAVSSAKNRHYGESGKTNQWSINHSNGTPFGRHLTATDSHGFFHTQR